MPKPTKPKKKARYSHEFKAQAVELANHPDIPVQDVAEALDIHPFMLSRWKKEYREGKIVVDKRKKKPLIDESTLSEKKHIRQLESLELGGPGHITAHGARAPAVRHTFQ